MLKILSELYLSKDMACIYTSRQDHGCFYFGRISAVNDEEVAISSVSQDGDDDGIIVMPADDVVRVETGSRYCEKMRKPCAEKVIDTDKYTIDGDNIALSLLQSAAEKKLFVSIELLDSGYDDVIGYVESAADGECKVRQVDEYGYEDGYSSFSVRDITYMSCDSQDEKRLMRLWKINRAE